MFLLAERRDDTQREHKQPREERRLQGKHTHSSIHLIPVHTICEVRFRTATVCEFTQFRPADENSFDLLIVLLTDLLEQKLFAVKEKRILHSHFMKKASALRPSSSKCKVKIISMKHDEALRTDTLLIYILD